MWHFSVQLKVKSLFIIIDKYLFRIKFCGEGKIWWLPTFAEWIFKETLNYLDIDLRRSHRAFYVPVYLYIQLWPAQVIHPFKWRATRLYIFLQTITPENFKLNKKGMGNLHKGFLSQKDSDRSKCWNLGLTRCWSIHVYKHKFLQNIQTYRKDWKSYLNEHFSRSKASTVIH